MVVEEEAEQKVEEEVVDRVKWRRWEGDGRCVGGGGGVGCGGGSRGGGGRRKWTG